MSNHTSANGARVRLSDINPQISGDEMLAELVPPRQFDRATFDSYRSDDEYPSQADAKQRLIAFAGGAVEKPAKRGFFSRAPKIEATKPGMYLDGGFGVGKTHLLASIYHAMPARRKLFGSFIEFTALVGALGYRQTVELLTGTQLICIDEFELDDPGDTMVMTRLLGELVGSGTKLAATSNTPPNALGEGRFAAQDFMREIHAMSASFDTLRIDGNDYRQRDLSEGARVVDPGEYDTALDAAARGGKASDDAFDELISHLSRVHPSRYMKMLDGVEAIGLRGVETLTDQNAALRLVAFIDRAYDAQTPIIATGVALQDVFAPEMLAGGYRKKYLRAISRMVALTHEG